MNVALYARVSTDKCELCGKNPASHILAGQPGDKSDRPSQTGLGSAPPATHPFRGQDPEVQLLELRAWCVANKHTVIREYVDRGVSGTKASRPQLDCVMADATKGLRDIEIVAVLRLDRFGRSVQHLHKTVGDLLASKVDFVSVKDNFDLTTPMGKLLFGILAVFAEFERNVIAERTKDGLKKCRSEGRIPGRKIDPTKGPSRTTAWRQRIGARALTAVLALAAVIVRHGKLLG
jgi:DNA invertase Pin-like site-specific DNA recombinase